MVLISIAKQKDETYEINRWRKDILDKRRGNLIKTHEAVTSDMPTAAQIEQFRHSPPDALRTK